MQNVMFSPQPRPEEEDVVATTLAKIARTILVVVLGLTPIFFIPAAYAPFNFTKIIFVIVGVLLALIFYSLSVLRAGRLEVHSYAGLWAAWALAAIVFLAAAFSGDLRDSILGDGLGIQTAGFVALLALVISTVTILREKKNSIMQVYILLTGSGLVIGLYHVLRFIFGPDTLTLGVFTGATSTPIGGWNDLALFFGLSLLLALVAVEQFPLTKWGKVLFGTVSALSLIVLAVVNFFAIWIVLGLVSLIVLMYSLTKNRFKSGQLAVEQDSSNTMASIILSVTVFIISMVFITGGSTMGQYVAELTGVSYVEVRPSLQATLNITRAVYGENMLFGEGPNRFIDAWRQHKDPAINQTIFWNSPFEAGVGYIPTFAATTGIVGILAWFALLFFVLRAGVRILFTSNHVDRFWYFVGVSSFVSAVYLWGMSLIYVPGPAILILAAVFTGILFASQSAVVPQRALTFSIAHNRRHGFAMVAIAIVIIVSAVSVLYFTGRQYSGLLTFNRALASIQVGVPIETIEERIAESYALFGNDRFAREIVGLQLQKMNSMLTLEEPTDAQRQQFQSIVVNAINAAQLAVDTDPTEPRNWQSLGNVYSLLASTGVEGAAERAREAFNNAAQYDPQNPEIQLQLAQLESRTGNLEGALAKAQEAIELKQNYTSAYFFISQIQIAQGNVEAAIQSTLSSITLEPRNPARYYQLGVLYSSEGQTQEAARAFEAAVELDRNYANARYFLALAYDELGRSADAREQLEAVLELNPGNEDVIRLLERLGRGEPLSADTASPEVSDVEPTVGEGGEVLTPEDPDSPLLSPVNTVPGENEEDAFFESEGGDASGTTTDTDGGTEEDATATTTL